MAMITNDWLPAIQGEFKKPYYRELFQFVKEEYGLYFPMISNPALQKADMEWKML